MRISCDKPIPLLTLADSLVLTASQIIKKAGMQQSMIVGSQPAMMEGDGGGEEAPNSRAVNCAIGMCPHRDDLPEKDSSGVRVCNTPCNDCLPPAPAYAPLPEVEQSSAIKSEESPQKRCYAETCIHFVAKPRDGDGIKLCRMTAKCKEFLPGPAYTNSALPNESPEDFLTRIRNEPSEPRKKSIEAEEIALGHKKGGAR
ncbi:MAG: hypothetical protein WC329_04355 [Candidatus Omnitrophota bacterium]